MVIPQKLSPMTASWRWLFPGERIQDLLAGTLLNLRAL